MKIKEWDPSLLETGIPKGAYRNVPNDVYHEITEYIGRSQLMKMRKSPAHFKYALENPKDPTDSLIFGNFLHTFVLEPHLVFELYARELHGVSKQSKAGKAKHKEHAEKHEGKIIMKRKDWREAIAMTRVIREHSYYQALTKSGEPEITFFGEINGVKTKCRLDWCNYKKMFFWDYKTTADASKESFIKSISNFDYDVQADFYAHTIFSATGEHMRGFMILAQEKEPPYCPNQFQLHDDFYSECGRPKYMPLLETYKKCKETGVWPGYEEKIIEAIPYHWMKPKEDDNE